MKTEEMSPEDYVYVVAWWPTFENREAIHTWIADGNSQNMSFPTATDAVAHAIEHEWWPFVVERVPRG